MHILCKTIEAFQSVFVVPCEVLEAPVLIKLKEDWLNKAVYKIRAYKKSTTLLDNIWLHSSKQIPSTPLA